MRFAPIYYESIKVSPCQVGPQDEDMKWLHDDFFFLERTYGILSRKKELR